MVEEGTGVLQIGRVLLPGQQPNYFWGEFVGHLLYLGNGARKEPLTTLGVLPVPELPKFLLMVNSTT